MPTVKNIPGPYRLYFYSFDCNEPKHVHVQKGEKDLQILAGAAILGQECRLFSNRTKHYTTNHRKPSHQGLGGMG